MMGASEFVQSAMFSTPTEISDDAKLQTGAHIRHVPPARANMLSSVWQVDHCEVSNYDARKVPHLHYQIPLRILVDRPSSPPLKDPDPSIAGNKVQPLPIPPPVLPFLAALARDSHHPGDVPRSARVQHPQADHPVRRVRLAQHEGGVLLLQRRVLPVEEGVVRREGEDRRVNALGLCQLGVGALSGGIM